MHQEIIHTYQQLMANLANLPGEIAAVQTDLNAAKTQLALSERTLADLEAQAMLTAEGSNAEKRKADVIAKCAADPVYVRWGKAADTERADIARLTVEFDRLGREFTAVGYAARMTASMAEMLAAVGPTKLTTDVNFYPANGNGKAPSANSGHTMTAADAADLGL
jgi:hypothetical protein